MPVNDVALLKRRRLLLGQLAATVGMHLSRVWLSLGHYTAGQQVRWEELATPPLVAGQSRAIDLQVAYLAALLGGPLRFDRKHLLEVAAVDLRMPFIALAKAFDGGASFDEAREAGRVRVAGTGESGVQWAARAANTAADDRRIVGWQRTLSGSACEWCVLVAGQVYKTAEAASFGHAKNPCNCGVDPIIGDRNPGRQVNEEVLQTAA